MGRRIRFGKTRSKAAVGDRQYGRDERVGRYYYFVAGFEASHFHVCAQDKAYGVESVAGADGMPRAGECGQFALESLHLVAAYVAPVGEHAFHGAAYGRKKRFVDASEVEKRIFYFVFSHLSARFSLVSSRNRP